MTFQQRAASMRKSDCTRLIVDPHSRDKSLLFEMAHVRAVAVQVPFRNHSKRAGRRQRSRL
jgi:hypothetical protein